MQHVIIRSIVIIFLTSAPCENLVGQLVDLQHHFVSVSFHGVHLVLHEMGLGPDLLPQHCEWITFRVAWGVNDIRGYIFHSCIILVLRRIIIRRQIIGWRGIRIACGRNIPCLWRIRVYWRVHRRVLRRFCRGVHRRVYRRVHRLRHSSEHQISRVVSSQDPLFSDHRFCRGRCCRSDHVFALAMAQRNKRQQANPEKYAELHCDCGAVCSLYRPDSVDATRRVALVFL